MAHDDDDQYLYPVDIYDEERNLNNLIDSSATERSIYITARKTNYPDNQSLSSPRFYMEFCFLHRTRCSDIRHSADSDTNILSTWLEFHHPFDRFASVEGAKAVVARILSDEETIPYSVNGGDSRSSQSLLWTDLDASAALELFQHGFDDVVTRISEAAARIVSEAAAAGRKVVEMVITFDKRTVVPHDELQRLIAHYVEYRQDTELNRAIGQSFSESAGRFGSVPAAKSAVEALERFRYERSSARDEDDQSKCVICMEELTIGSHVTCLPCSHIFHGGCILEWLNDNHTCPLCRFKLPSQ
ncbi:E3 ubiquitin-protein ligase RING1-like protein [Morus notabilis]|uniref:RING-type E3 ubiquitin transferase n=1 Tax=Morus notabilis TaxID=981085 RepID=W9RYN2_9ROSA|nr:E3 ubiquitin-protein ligase RING1-like protein [Morus notabilis]